MKDPEILLHYIDVLLKESNFTRAAQELYISQPYLTQLLKRIEHKLGTKIINRKTTPFTLTKAGVIYYKYLETTTANNQNLAKKLIRYASPKKEIIRIGVLESLGTFLIPELLPDFLAENPNIEIQLSETFPRNSETQLLNEQIDCYIGQTPESLNTELDFFVNGEENYYVIISPQSSYFKKDRFILNQDEYNLKEILQQPFVVSFSNSAIRHQVNGIFHKFNVKPNIVLESKSILTATNLAIKGVGLTISAASIIKRMNRTPINLLPLDHTLIQIKYFIAVKHKKRLDPGLKKLITKFTQLRIQPSIK
ncbi:MULTISPECIES: LysR family transcriptional regulator [unclassified Lactobacillus]|uniref:LysR family transcriptional regulator n=1 Tax=unclassified Lactobacillus TaxID=2620435 RepID=UPI000EFA4E98|nr:MULTISPECIES: LysR family transcriptional regulator [unclassified Lactobacillus]RMC47427.1 LysR family transcriptional regulator [Lactobacillus sp. ESL0230]RMC51946.1 LysR family transcriptional regulator [Lactobacillus sp. ESL0225]